MPTLLHPTPDVQVFASEPPAAGWHTAPPEPATGYAPFTLVFIVDRPASKVLLGFKKRGLGKGLWNGFGGKPEAGEGIVECAVREVKEECGLTVDADDMQPMGELCIVRALKDGSPALTIVIHMFIAEKWEGTPEETEEMNPRWVREQDIPYDTMWEEQSRYVPALLGADMPPKKRFVGRVDGDETGTLAGLWMGWRPLE